MKSHLLLIRTLTPDTVPTPPPSLIADLVDAVLKTPGMRVASVETLEIATAAITKRKIRLPKAAGAVAHGTELQNHPFMGSGTLDVCAFCMQPKAKHKV